MMNLKDLLNGVKFTTKDDISALKINSVTSDSRTVTDGDTFIAVNGYSIDGHKFIKEAISKGAKVILAEKDFDSPPGIKKILIDDVRKSLPAITNNFYKCPSEKLKMIGVTGTNGKTTITYIIESILKNAGREAGVIGTINYRFKDKILTAKNTTPGPLELGGILKAMADEGLSHVVMEVSSHSLDQHRVDGLSFDTAIFTNITSEHLDYHRTIRNYFNAKAKLFDRLKTDGVAILNNDDKKVAGLKRSMKRKVITYGIKEDADITAKAIRLSLDDCAFSVVAPNGSVEIKTGLIGAHNISNILASVAAAFAEGLDLATIKRGVESLKAVPGRLELIDSKQPFRVFVDYAHTEDALYNTLSILRNLATKDIITVFGCGGNRDKTKRPLMGKVACRFSDKVIITSDNPRFEEPNQIIKEIESGIKAAYSNYDVVEDRHSAIERALSLASQDDIVVIAGKGHEKYQITKDRTLPFDDCEVVRSILNDKKYESRRDSKDNKREIALRRS